MSARRTSTPQDVKARVAALRRDGVSYSCIAEVMGLTKNQVAGILSRAGLTKAEAGMFGTGRKRPARKVKANSTKVDPGANGTPAPPAPAVTPEPVQAPEREPAAQEEDPEDYWVCDAMPAMPGPAGCPYILGEKGRDFARYEEAKRCGAEGLPGSPYCNEHDALCYQPAPRDGRGKSAEFTFKETF